MFFYLVKQLLYWRIFKRTKCFYIITAVFLLYRFTSTVNLAKFLRIPFLKEHLRWLLLTLFRLGLLGAAHGWNHGAAHGKKLSQISCNVEAWHSYSLPKKICKSRDKSQSLKLAILGLFNGYFKYIILSHVSNCVADVVMSPKFGNSSISLRGEKLS